MIINYFCRGLNLKAESKVSLKYNAYQFIALKAFKHRKTFIIRTHFLTFDLAFFKVKITNSVLQLHA